jgi:hypothetical protein
MVALDWCSGEMLRTIVPQRRRNGKPLCSLHKIVPSTYKKQPGQHLPARLI